MPSLYRGNATVFSLNSVIIGYDPLVSVEALAGGHAKEKGGTGEVVSDDEVFDFVLEVPANSTTC